MRFGNYSFYNVSKTAKCGLGVNLIQLQNGGVSMRKRNYVMLLSALLVAGVWTGAKVQADTGMESQDAVLVDAVNFPDTAIREFAALYDADSDGKLSAKEREQVKNIYITEKDSQNTIILISIHTSQRISTYKGVECFPNIECITVTSSGIADSGILQREFLPYAKQAKQIRLDYSYWNVEDKISAKDMDFEYIDGNCELLSVSGVQFRSFKISSKKLARLNIEKCILPKNYQIDTPNLERMRMREVYAPSLNYGVHVDIMEK